MIEWEEAGQESARVIFPAWKNNEINIISVTLFHNVKDYLEEA
jgi:hypothetical protein